MITERPKVVILGTGGFAIELAALIRDDGQEILGFVGPTPQRALPGPHLGDDSVLETSTTAATYFVAIGEPALRRSLSEKLEAMNHKIGSLVHPAAWLADNAITGDGAIIYPNATIHAGVHLGRGTLINSNATVGHETVIGDYCNIGPGVSLGGKLTIGQETYFGIGASAIEQLSITAGTIIGAGATVIYNVPTAGIYVGTPARRVVFKENQID